MTDSKASPRLSVITVVYNGEAYIEKTIRSVLGQTFAEAELIVIDGGSTDQTLEIIRKYDSKVRWISEPDNGIYDAMNKGIAMARGEWINFLNGGDSYYDDMTLSGIFLRTGLEKVNFIYGDSINVFGNTNRYIKAVSLSRSSIRKYLGICHQAVFARRSIAPLYDLSYRYKAEYNWVIDIVTSISEPSILYLKTPVVYYPLGGFSERGVLKNLMEFISVTRKRFGWTQVILNTFTYMIVLLRSIKYIIFGYEW